MTKHILLCLLTCLLIATLHGQINIIAESEVFDEPGSGHLRILQLTNSNTILVNVDEKIHIRLYHADHKLAEEKTLKPSYGKAGALREAFEMNGTVVLLLTKLDGTRDVLQRVIIDAKTGELIRDQKIGELDKVSVWDKPRKDKLAAPAIYTCSNTSLNTYATACYYPERKELNRLLEVVVYGESHQELSRAFVTVPDDKFRYLQFLDMTVTAPATVAVLAAGYTTFERNESEVFLSTLNNVSRDFKLSRSLFPANLDVATGSCRLNATTNQLISVVSTKVKKEEENNTVYLGILNIKDCTSRHWIDANPDASLLAKLVAKYGKKSSFKGEVQAPVVHKDGSFTIVREEIEIYSMKGESATLHADTHLNNLLVSNYNADGTLRSSYFIPKSQKLVEVFLSKNYHHSKWEMGGLLFDRSTQFKSYAFVPGAATSCILFNDLPENAEKEGEGKWPRTVNVISDAEAYVFPLTGNNTFPTREYMFGKSTEKNTNHLCLFIGSHYDPITNTFATLKLRNSGRKKEMSLVWMKF